MYSFCGIAVRGVKIGFAGDEEITVMKNEK
jgi:hypothetical protein